MWGVVKISIMWEKVLERVCVIYKEANLGTAEVFIEGLEFSPIDPSSSSLHWGSSCVCLCCYHYVATTFDL